MMLLLSVQEAQEEIRKQVKALRKAEGWTQAELSKRSGVPLATLRKFEQTGQISLKGLLKILMVLGKLGEISQALKIEEPVYKTLSEIPGFKEIK